ncbi:MAG: hypothetical protein HW416_3365, partial [Chloroflexi bacterium]|nr:hypothetical protein [Chloroflexota bacterium]
LLDKRQRRLVKGYGLASATDGSDYGRLALSLVPENAALGKVRC